MKVTILGTGAYGIALALMLAKKENNQVFMWTESNEAYNEYQKTGNLRSILDKKLPSNIRVTNSCKEALEDTKLIIFACTSKYVKSVATDIKSLYKGCPICIASKGIDDSSLMFLSNIVKSILKVSKIAVISGPTFAEDLANNEPSALAIASKNKDTIRIVKENLENDTLKLRETNDLIGVQICGSIKNVIAIASGILNGLGYTESTQAFLINESIHDIKFLIKELGGDTKTILSFAGIGDLLLTCMSKKSRNYTFGTIIGSGKNKEKYIKENTVEGYYTLLSMYDLIKKKSINLPIVDLIYDIVINNKEPKSLADFLIAKK